jgi:hypothetical protein
VNKISAHCIHRGSSWSTATRRIGSVHVVSFEVHHPVQCTAGAAVSKVMKMTKDVCSKAILLQQGITAQHFDKMINHLQQLCHSGL